MPRPRSAAPSRRHAPRPPRRAAPRRGGTHRKTEHQAIVEPCVSKVERARLVEPFHQALVDCIAATVPEADEPDRHRRRKLELLAFADLRGEPVGKFDARAHVRPQPLGAIVANDEPQLESAEPAAQRNVPVPVIDDLAGFRGLVAQVLRQDAERADQRGAIRDPEAVAVEVGEQPLVRIEGVAVRVLDPVVETPVLGADGCAARMRGVDVQPDACAAADLADGADRIDGARRSRAHGGAHHRRHRTGRTVRGNRRFQRVDAHRVTIVGIDEAQVGAPESGNPDRLFDRRVSVPRRVSGQSRHGAVREAMLVDRAAARTFARRDQRGEGAARRGVLNDPAATAGGTESGGQSEQVDEPVEHVRLELSARGARRPEHSLDAQPGGEKIAENCRSGCVGRKEREEIRRLPVGDARHDNRVDVAKHVRERLAPLRRRAWQPIPD